METARVYKMVIQCFRRHRDAFALDACSEIPPHYLAGLIFSEARNGSGRSLRGESVAEPAERAAVAPSPPSFQIST